MANTNFKDFSAEVKQPTEVLETVEATTTDEVVAPEPVKAEVTPKKVVEESKPTKVVSTAPFTVGKCYTYTHAANVHTEPKLDALVVSVRSIGETVVPEKIHEADGYFWAEYHRSPKHLRFSALGASDGSTTFVK